VVLKDEVLRLVEIPLVIRLPGMPQVARGAQVRLDIVRWDELDLSLEARLLEVAEPTPEAAAAMELEEEEEAVAATADATADTGEAAAEEAAEAEGSVTVTDPATQTDVPAT
jgi:exoribonuclease-2